jgi:hypothetical protein
MDEANKLRAPCAFAHVGTIESNLPEFCRIQFGTAVISTESLSTSVSS